MVAGALNGQYVGKFRTIDEEVDLLVRIARLADKGNINGTGLAEPLDIPGIPVIEDSTSPILLRDLIEVKPARRIADHGLFYRPASGHLNGAGKPVQRPCPTANHHFFGSHGDGLRVGFDQRHGVDTVDNAGQLRSLRTIQIFSQTNVSPQSATGRIDAG